MGTTMDGCWFCEGIILFIYIHVRTEAEIYLCETMHEQYIAPDACHYPLSVSRIINLYGFATLYRER